MPGITLIQLQNFIKFDHLVLGYSLLGDSLPLVLPSMIKSFGSQPKHRVVEIPQLWETLLFLLYAKLSKSDEAASFGINRCSWKTVPNAYVSVFSFSLKSWPENSSVYPYFYDDNMYFLRIVFIFFKCHLFECWFEFSLSINISRRLMISLIFI